MPSSRDKIAPAPAADYNDGFIVHYQAKRVNAGANES